MGGNAKKWAIGGGLAALTALSMGAALPALGAAATAGTIGGVGLSTGGLVAGGLLGAAQGINTVNQMNQADRTERINAEANRQKEAVAARELGSTPNITTNENNLSDFWRKKSGKARTIFAERAARNISQKLGD